MKIKIGEKTFIATFRHNQFGKPVTAVAGVDLKAFQTPKGTTVCHIVDPETETVLASGVALCGPKDAFCKDEGRKHALKRACHSLADNIVRMDPHELTREVFAQYAQRGTPPPKPAPTAA